MGADSAPMVSLSGRASLQLLQDLRDVERCQADLDAAILGLALRRVIARDRPEGSVADGRKILGVDAGLLLQVAEHRRRPHCGQLPVGRELLTKRDRKSTRLNSSHEWI